MVVDRFHFLHCTSIYYDTFRELCNVRRMFSVCPQQHVPGVIVVPSGSPRALIGQQMGSYPAGPSPSDGGVVQSDCSNETTATIVNELLNTGALWCSFWNLSRLSMQKLYQACFACSFFNYHAILHFVIKVGLQQ